MKLKSAKEVARLKILKSARKVKWIISTVFRIFTGNIWSCKCCDVKFDQIIGDLLEVEACLFEISLTFNWKNVKLRDRMWTAPPWSDLNFELKYRIHSSGLSQNNTPRGRCKELWKWNCEILTTGLEVSSCKLVPRRGICFWFPELKTAGCISN